MPCAELVLGPSLYVVDMLADLSRRHENVVVPDQYSRPVVSPLMVPSEVIAY